MVWSWPPRRRSHRFRVRRWLRAQLKSTGISRQLHWPAARAWPRRSRRFLLMAVAAFSLVLLPLAGQLWWPAPVQAQVAALNASFSPLQVYPGETSRLTIVLFNSTPVALTNASLANSLPSGMVIANPANISTNCGGAISATSGDSSFALAGATVPAKVGFTDGQCSISVDVFSTAQGNSIFTIPANALVTDQGTTNSTSASATLQVRALAAPSLNKSFAPNTIFVGTPSILTVRIINNGNIALTKVAITDNLPTNVTVAGVANKDANCQGGSVTSNSTSVSLSGVTINAGATCQITVPVTSTVTGTYTNTLPAGSITNQQGVTNATAATANLSAQNNITAPTLSKSFLTPVVVPNVPTILRIVITDQSPLVDLTNVALTDNLPTGLTIASPPNATKSADCQGGTLSAAAGDTSISISGVTIAKTRACTIEVRVVASAPGSYVNTLPAGSITNSEGVTNANPASATLLVEAIQVSKAFAASPISPNTPTRLTITLRNGTAAPLTGISFTDTFPSGLTVAATPNAATTCGSGSVAASGGGGTVSLTGGTLTANATCTVVVDVIATTTGNKVNSIPAGGVTTDQGFSNLAPASSTVAVNNNIVNLTKSFTNSSVAIGVTSRLRIRINIPSTNSSNATDLAFTDTLPAGLLVASPPNISAADTNCRDTIGAPKTITAVAGSNTIAVSGLEVTRGTTNCDVFVDVVGTVQGVYTNTIPAGGVTTQEGYSNPAAASANLTVIEAAVSKAFSPSQIAAGGRTTLTVTITNFRSVPITGVNLTDNLPTSPAVRLAAVPNASTTCGGGVVNAVAGGASFSLSNGTIPPQVGGVAGVCTFQAEVTSAAASGTATNVINANAMTSNEGITNLSQATAVLSLGSLNIQVNKAFSPLTITGGSVSTLTVELTNPSSTQTYLGVQFTDTMPAGMVIAAPANASTTCVNAVLSASAGSGSFSLSDAQIAPNSVCSVTVDVTSSQPGNLTNTIPVGGVTTSQGARNTSAASASLTNLPGLGVGKEFVPNQIEPGGISRLTITFINANTLTLTGLNLTDTMPVGVEIAAAPNPATTCSGTISTTTNSVTLSDGTVAPTAVCTISIDVTAPAAGDYLNEIPAGAISSTQGASNAKNVTSPLAVRLRPTLSKQFNPSSIQPGETSTLTIQLGNANTTAATLTAALVDNLPSGLTVSNPANIGGSCPSAGVTAAPNTMSVAYTSGSTIPAGGCSITVSVTASTTGTKTNLLAADALQTSIGSNANPATADLAVGSSSPNLVLVKRLTALNPGGAGAVSYSNTYVNVGSSSDEDNAAGWPLPADPISGISQYLGGIVSSGTTQPGDTLEFTIYFLSNGTQAASNVQICDLVPVNTQFLADGFNGLSPNDGGSGNQGIALKIGSSSPVYLSNGADVPDRGQFFDAGSQAPAACNAPGFSSPLSGSANSTGAVVVTLPNVPAATGAGVPDAAYGLFRFRVRVR
jgi:uncharacterized repeat protein (TIGR01451 family)